MSKEEYIRAMKAIDDMQDGTIDYDHNEYIRLCMAVLEYEYKNMNEEVTSP